MATLRLKVIANYLNISLLISQSAQNMFSYPLRQFGSCKPKSYFHYVEIHKMVKAQIHQKLDA